MVRQADEYVKGPLQGVEVVDAGNSRFPVPHYAAEPPRPASRSSRTIKADYVSLVMTNIDDNNRDYTLHLAKPLVIRCRE